MVLAIESLTELQVTSATEFSVWGGHFYVGTSTKHVEKPDMEGAPTKQSSNLFSKFSTLIALEIHKKGSQTVSIRGGKCDITSPKTFGYKNSVHEPRIPTYRYYCISQIYQYMEGWYPPQPRNRQGRSWPANPKFHRVDSIHAGERCHPPPPKLSRGAICVTQARPNATCQPICFIRTPCKSSSRLSIPP